MCCLSRMAAEPERVFQISGIRNAETKRSLLKCISSLGGIYAGGSAYSERTTHLIARNVSPSEKFLAACAAGIWVLRPEYVTESARAGRWLAEEPREWGSPARRWRGQAGAFRGWRVALLLGDAGKRKVFERILKAGKATVYHCPPSTQEFTHVLVKNMRQETPPCGAPCYSLNYIAQHLFEETESPRAMPPPLSPDTQQRLFSELELKLKEHVLALEVLQAKCASVDFQNCYSTADCNLQKRRADFSNASTLTESGLFTEALEEIRWTLGPGVLPPVGLMHVFMSHALQDAESPLFVITFLNTLHDVFRNNPPWGWPSRVGYFLSLLQCPECKEGPWAFLEASARRLVSGGPCCHLCPEPVSPEQEKFHAHLLAFLLDLYRFDLHSLNTREPGGGMSSVLVHTFWNVWEKSTLATKPLQQLAKLLVEATQWLLASKEVSRPDVVSTLHEIFGVAVEFWRQDNSRLNRDLAEKGMKDFADYLSILWQDSSPEVLVELVTSLQSPWLKMFVADAIYRHLCSKSCIAVGPEPLSLHKIVSPYLTALGRLACSGPGPGGAPEGAKMERWPGIEPPRTPRSAAPPHRPAIKKAAHLGLGESTPLPAKADIPRGLHKVNRAGETLLHRVCKQNQAEKLITILSLPGTDINVKDHAGWTPLHEACNHGSAACVRAILRLCPGVDLLGPAGGLSPLQDALLAGHADVAGLLLRHAGSVLLQQQDSEGRTPLDRVDCPALREELVACAREGDAARLAPREGASQPGWLELGGALLGCLLVSYALVRHLPPGGAGGAGPDGLAPLARCLAAHTARAVTSGWTDARLVRLAEDIETLLKMPRYVAQAPAVATSCSGPRTGVLPLLLGALMAEGQGLLALTARGASGPDRTAGRSPLL
ncbi:SMC5-SMC6 complex localization factor protein 1 isoform X2 [Lepisosteus oculatus]